MKSDLPTMGVASCSTCHAELQVVCPNGHDPEPIEFDGKRLKPETVNRIKRGIAVHGKATIDRSNETYNIAEIIFDSASGATATDVEKVNRPAPAARVYQDRMCQCGATFTPTGPRDVRCPKCKGGTT